MKGKGFRCLLIVCLSVPWAVYAQGIADFYGKPFRQGNGFSIRAGINYSIPTVTAYYVNSSTPISILWGVRPKPGFYFGGSYYTDLLPNRISLRIDGTLQMKSTGNIDLSGNLVRTSRYFYGGIRPLIGLQLAKKVVVYTGVEANLLVTSQHDWGNTYPIDIGTTVRGAYQIGLYRLEVGYYRGFMKYDNLDIKNLPGGPTQHDFYNQTWEVGLIYNLK